MTNAEKFLKDGVDKEKFCYELARHLNSTVGNDEARIKEFMAIIDYFLNCLCVPTLSEDERVILRNIDKRFKSIKRANDSYLYLVMEDNAFRDIRYEFEAFPSLFQFIKSGEEYLIEALLKC